MSGFFPVDHGDMIHPVFGVARRPFTRWEAYCWLLDHAAIGQKDTEFQGKPVKLDRGQVATSVGELARTWKWTKAAVQRFIKGLISAGFITYSPTVITEFQADTGPDTVADTGVTKLTLCKYFGIPAKKPMPDTVADTPPDTPPPMTPYRVTYVNNREQQRRRVEAGTSSATPSPPPDDQRQGDLLPLAEVVAFRVPDEQLAFDAYNALATKSDLRVCRSFNPQRRTAMRARLRELGGLEGWAAALDKVSESPFIRDWRTDGWNAFGLHSLLQPITLAKLMDGAYDGKRQKAGKPENPITREVTDYYRDHGHGETSLLHHFDHTGAVIKR